MGGNNYVIQVKGNQKKLKCGIEDYITDHECDDNYLEKEKNKGRVENRRIKVYRKIKGDEFRKWVGLKEIIVIRRWGIRGNKNYDKTHYYISSRQNTTAEQYAKGIRRHWWIENKLHWVKDVILYEDNSLVKNKVIAENLSLMRIIVMNLYRLNKYKSIKYAIEKYVNRIQKCELFIYE